MVDIIIPSDNGKIHLVYQKSSQNAAPLAVILSGNPKKGFHMNERVSYAMFRSFADAGFAVVRFNYRGIGLSSGFQDDPLDNMMDLSVVIDWIQNKNENSNQLWIAGYDFGAWLTAQALMRRPEITRFVMVSPDPSIKDLSFLSPRPNKGILFQGALEESTNLDFGKHLTELMKNHARIDTDIMYIKGSSNNYSESVNLKNLYNEIKNYAGKESVSGIL